MFKRTSPWPAYRSLLRDKGARSVIATWVVLILSIAAAALLAGLLQRPYV